MIVHRNVQNQLSLGQAGKLNGIEVEFRPSRAVEDNTIHVMETAVGPFKYILVAKVEPSLDEMAAAISDHIDRAPKRAKPR